MATNFPASLDALTNPTSSDSLSSPSHSAQHANVNDAVEALQAKVGADSSAVTSSLDYKVAQLESISHGKILQVVSTTKTDVYGTNSASYQIITDLTATMTPSSASSKILVQYSVPCASFYSAASQMMLMLAPFRDGTNLIVPDSPSNRTATVFSWQGYGLDDVTAIMMLASGTFLDSPATTSAVTYDMRILNAGTAYSMVNKSRTDTDTVKYPRGVSTLTVMEVAA